MSKRRAKCPVCGERGQCAPSCPAAEQDRRYVQEVSQGGLNSLPNFYWEAYDLQDEGRDYEYLQNVSQNPHWR